MTTKLYTLLGWFAWQGISILLRRKLADNKVKLGAATVAAVLVGGVLAAKSASDES